MNIKKLKTKQIIIPLIVICCMVLSFFIFKGQNRIKKLSVNQESIQLKKYKPQINSAEEYLQSSGFSGTVLVARKNKIVFAKGYGYSDIKNKKAGQNSLNTVYEAGSISKQFTAAAVIQLINQKKLSYDDKLIKFFPDYEKGSSITVRMLLTMRSGITDCINNSEEFFTKPVALNIEKSQLKNLPLEEDLILKHLNTAPLIAQPDSTYFYSNTNYYLLSKIVEQVSGLSFEEYVQKKLFIPCGLNSCNVKFQKTDAVGYDFAGRYYSLPAELAAGSGDLNCSAVDLYKWQYQLVNGKVKGLGKKGFNRMWNKEGGYGAGLFFAKNSIFHGGITNVFNSYSSYNFNSKFYVIVLSNKPVSDFNASFAGRKIYSCFVE